eukprot:10890148-Alexandrium_andersonii.AAC.1
MSASLVGSEMCIRDSDDAADLAGAADDASVAAEADGLAAEQRENARNAVSYTHLTLPTICSV